MEMEGSSVPRTPSVVKEGEESRLVSCTDQVKHGLVCQSQESGLSTSSLGMIRFA